MNIQRCIDTRKSKKPFQEKKSKNETNFDKIFQNA